MNGLRRAVAMIALMALAGGGGSPRTQDTDELAAISEQVWHPGRHYTAVDRLRVGVVAPSAHSVRAGSLH